MDEIYFFPRRVGNTSLAYYSNIQGSRSWYFKSSHYGVLWDYQGRLRGYIYRTYPQL